jgi:predicted XRE-type DNA-binding protein
MKRVRKLMTCECGFPGADRNRRDHRLSVYHRQHRTIKNLLSKDSLTFAEIGERLGITRERVRQIARQLGLTSGHERRKQHAMDKRMSAWREQKGHRELIAKCKELGYTVTPSRCDTRLGWRFEDGIVVINGWRTQIVHLRTRGRYFVFKRSVVRADFHVGISPVGYFVFPAKVWKTFPEGTEFSPIPCTSGQRGFTHSHRHDYLNYLEAWKLLGRRL